MTSRWLVTGAGGMLGRDLAEVLGAAGDVTVTPLTRAEFDLVDHPDPGAVIAGHDVVVNAAAWTDVDGAEADEAGATLVNGTAVATLAEACAANKARLLHLSTDYVFGGGSSIQDGPYPEDAPTGPINAYGRSKLAGELAVRSALPETGYVVRTAWLYGAHGKNFVTTMLRLAESKDTLDVVDDQWGQPTWSRALAAQLLELGRAALAGNAPPGVYHATAAGRVTWCGLAKAVFAEAGLDPARIRPVSSDQFPRPAPRPANSVLGHDRWAEAGLAPMADWRPTLREAMALPAFAGR